MPTDPRKRTISFDAADAALMDLEAWRLDCSRSRLIQEVWRIARDQIRADGDAILAARKAPPPHRAEVAQTSPKREAPTAAATPIPPITLPPTTPARAPLYERDDWPTI